MNPIIVEEWIGRRVRIISAPNPAHMGLEGKLVDETQGTLLILGLDSRERRVPKTGVRFEFSDANPKIALDAGKLVMRPEERTKKMYKKIKA